MFIQRDIEEKLKYLITKFPVVALTGSRQSGKSTLLKNTFPSYRYLTLEDLDLRQQAKDDPRGFLQNFGKQIIIDEAQHVPQLFSYIQTAVDAENEAGMYILSGSQNFLLIESITQSLAGRVALLKLGTFSISEMTKAGKLPGNLNEWLYTGGYPRIYDMEIRPADFYPNFIQTYIQRDVRLLKNITDIGRFNRFLKLCAARTGQLLNVASLASEAEITVPTVNSWLSILEASYIVFLLRPYHQNFNKRLVKSPKLYFHDTGLVASLLGLTSSDQLSIHYLRGELFENMVVSEFVKSGFSNGKDTELYFWRDSNQNEVDLLLEDGPNLKAIEIKSSATINNAFLKGLKQFQSYSGLPSNCLTVAYGGEFDYQTDNGSFVSWKNITKLL